MLLLLLVGLIVYRVLRTFWCVYIRPPFRIKRYIAKNSWALITGATDGIGKELAHQLAKLDANLILIGRNEQKLAKTKDEIMKAYRVQVQTIQIDLGQCFHEKTQQRILRIKEEIGPKNISILINNAGVISAPKTFDQISVEEINNMMAVNQAATLYITKAILPGMIQAKKGIIINVGSMAASFVTPYMQIYGATKSFIERFTWALNLEMVSKGIHAEYLCPYYVATKLSRLRRQSILVPTAAHFAWCAIRTFGSCTFNIPVPMHRLMYEVTQLLPSRIMGYFVMIERKYRLRMSGYSPERNSK